MDDSGVLTWCWKDSVCISLATAAIAAILAVARRLDSPEQTPRRRRNFAASCVHLATGGTIGGGTSFGLCLLGVSLWPTQGKVVSAVVILLAVSIDWTADTGRKFLLRLAGAFLPSLLGRRVRDLPGAPDLSSLNDSADGLDKSDS